MNIFQTAWNWITQYLNDIAEDNRRASKSKIRRKILADLRYIRNHDNEGLVRKRLMEMKDVVHFRSETGWPDIVDVRMSDGYEIRARDSYMNKTIRKAAIKVALRLREVYL